MINLKYKYEDVIKYWQEQKLESKEDYMNVLENFSVLFAYNSGAIENDKITSITEKADVWKLVGINTIYPLIILAVMSLIWLTFIGNHKNKKENKRLYLIVYIIFVVYLIAMTVLSNVYLYKSFIGMVS